MMTPDSQSTSTKEGLTTEFLRECLGAQLVGADLSKNKKNHKVTDHQIEITIKPAAPDAVEEVSRHKIVSNGVAIDVSHVGSSIPADLQEHRANKSINFILQTLKGALPDIRARRESAIADLDFIMAINLHDDIAAGDDLGSDMYRFGFSGPVPSQTLFIPDPHYLEFLRTPIADQTPLSDKKNKALFRGSDTNLQRIKLSVDTKENDFFDCKISRFIPGSFIETYEEVNKQDISAEWMGLNEQLQYKYILDPHGWTRGWDRPYWVLKSDSILVSIVPDDGIIHHNWYSRFMYDHDIVPLLTYEEALDPASFSSFDKYNEKQKVFGSILMDGNVAKAYVINLMLAFNRGFNS